MSDTEYFDGNDILIGGEGQDRVNNGGGGNDLLWTGIEDLDRTGNDILIGGEDPDRVNNGGGGNDLLWTGIEDLDRTGNDVLIAEDDNDLAGVNTGNDVLIGGIGEDFVLDTGLGAESDLLLV